MKFFDVDWNTFTRNPQPVAVIQFISVPPESIEIVPTIFITNRTFEHISNSDASQLSRRIIKKIYSLIPTSFQKAVKEIQMDCDWSDRTKGKYFKFLDTMRSILNDSVIILSATIRLHQFGDPVHRGVPPVDQGVLMYYNMGEMEGPYAVNSIFDLEVGRRYLLKVDTYPLHLDVVLPLYSWGVLIRRDKIVNLLHDIQREILQDTTFFENIAANMYSVKKNHYYNGTYLYVNDKIRYEAVGIEQLQYAVDDLRRKFSDQSPSIIFFQLGPTLEKQYGTPAIRSLVSSFYN
jgi:hypothetical protein